MAFPKANWRPILFTMVSDFLSPACKSSVYVKYADDVTAVHIVRLHKDDMLQQEWSHIENWSKSFGLCLNYCKSCVMNCITKRSLGLGPINTDDGNMISTVSSLRILGLIFSTHLTMDANDFLKKCYHKFFILGNSKRACCHSPFVHKYYVLFIRSVLLYSFSCFLISLTIYYYK